MSSPRKQASEAAGLVEGNIVLVLAPNAWEGPWMNRQQLMSRLGRKLPIIYSTGIPQIGRRKGFAGGILRGALVRRDGVLLDAPPAWLVRPASPPWLRHCADELSARRWWHIAGRLGGSSVTAYVFHPKFWPQVKRLQPSRLVYHAYDLYHLQGEQAYVFDREERALVKAADLVVASSAPIADHLRSIGASRVEVIENAADYDAFASVDQRTHAEPADLAGVPRPRVGYTGALNSKVDFPLMARLAERLPDVQFVFVGKVGRVDPRGERAMEQLSRCPNVHFVGFKERSVLPSYMAAMDVNVMAYRIADDVWTAGIYPLKLHEYLATGQPVVSADLPTVRPYSEVIRIATDADDWERGLTDALSGRAPGTVATRRECARRNTWDARAEQLHALLRAMEPAAGSAESGNATKG